MPLTFQPRPGTVVMCDFVGNVLPEMVKVRPVVVVARNRGNRHLVTVVPLSTTAPVTMAAHHHQLDANPLPGREKVTCWAKCDMISTVSLSRLDRYKVAPRRYVAPRLPTADLVAIKAAIAKALGLGETMAP